MTVKRMFKLQQIKSSVMLDALQDIAGVLSNSRNEIPRPILEKLTDILEKFLKLNERIDNLRQKNIDNFYNRLRNGLENTLSLEVQNEKEKE